MKKSFIRYLLSLSLASSLLFSAAYAAVSLPYWYSNEREFYRYAYQPVAWYTHYNNLFTTTLFAQSAQHAKNEWTDNGLNVNLTTVATSENMKIYGGSRSRMKVIDPRLPSSAFGLTDHPSSMQSDFFKIGNIDVIGYTTYHSRIVVVYNQTFAEVPDNPYYKNIVTHEMGHALGWIGHSSNSNDLMYPNPSNTRTTVQNRDKLHLTQVYDLYPY